MGHDAERGGVVNDKADNVFDKLLRKSGKGGVGLARGGKKVLQVRLKLPVVVVAFPHELQHACQHLAWIMAVQLLRDAYKRGFQALGREEVGSLGAIPS